MSDLEDVLALFGATIREWRGGTITPDPVPGWEGREVEFDAGQVPRGGLRHKRRDVVDLARITPKVRAAWWHFY